MPPIHNINGHSGATGPDTTALDPPPPPGVASLTLKTPSGVAVEVPVTRAGASAQVRYAETSEPGIYRLTLPSPPGGFAYAAVEGDRRESDPAPLDPAEAEVLARGWPLAFDADPARLADRLLVVDRARRSEVWHGLILAALAGLCLEVWLTRRMTRGQAMPWARGSVASSDEARPANPP